MAVDSAPAGSVVHAVAEEGVPTRDIAEAIARQLGVEAVSVPASELAEQIGFVGRFFALDLRASSALTRERFDWTPTHPGLIAHIDAGYYTD